MNRITYVSIFAAGMLIVNACAPVYKCGEVFPDKKVKGSKRLKAVVVERDQLCLDLAEKNARNTELQEQLSSANSRNADMQKKYNSLIDQSMSQEEYLNQALKAKSDELNEKERLLLQREKSLRDLQAIIYRQDSITKRLNDVLRNALLGFNSDELSVEIRNGKVYVSMSDKLLFKSGSATVESKGQEAIKLLADVLQKNQDIDILIEGHTDNVPIKTAVYKDNWDLSVARATSIVRMLTDDYKIPPTRVTASGKGEFSPRETNATPEGRARNRRTEIILSPKLDELMNLLNR